MKISRYLKTSLLVYPLAFATIAPLSAANADQTTAELVAKYAYAGTLQQGIAALNETRATNPANGEATFGLGALQFFSALEGLQQDLYRYGAGNSQSAQLGQSFLPVLRVPVAPNPKPEVASYEKIREIIERFVDRMKQVDTTLAGIGEQPFKLPLDLAKIRYDMDGDGAATEQERFLPLLSIMTNMRGRGFSGAKSMSITFDTADAHWLRGYSNALMSIGNFFLSFDFENSYDASFHTVFGAAATKFGRQFGNAKGDPVEIAELKANIAKTETKIAEVTKQSAEMFTQEHKARLKKLSEKQIEILRNKSLSRSEKTIKSGEHKDELKQLRDLQRKSRTTPNQLRREKRDLEKRLAALDPESGGRASGMEGIYDPISFLHTINWKVTDPERLKTVRQNLLTVMKLNITTWGLVAKETDDDHEWLPNPKQTGPFSELKVTQEIIDGWLKTTSAAEDVLEGRLLTPHMRYGRGINMKRFFEEAKHFDLVLFLTGPNSIQYVEKGPVWDQSLMRTLSGPMGRNFGAFALWFN